MITGDDILIEYVTRLVKTLQQSQSEVLLQPQMKSMESFVTHYVWKQPDQLDDQMAHKSTPSANSLSCSGNIIRKRLANRLNEMTDRRRRLIKYNYKKEEK